MVSSPQVSAGAFARAARNSVSCSKWFTRLQRVAACALLLWPAFLPAASLRYYGNGVNDIDRVKVQIDVPGNSNPGPPADIGATDFTIEFWIKGAAADNRATARCGGIYGWIEGNTVVDRDRFNQRRSFGIALTSGRVAFGLVTDNDLWTLCGGRSVLDGQWHHVAVQRTLSGAMSIYIDGTLDAQASGPAGDLSYPDNGTPGNYCGPSGNQSCANSDPYIVIGAEKHDAGSAYPSFRGWLDELRLSTVRRYSSSFTPPAQPFVADSQTAALYHFDEGSGDVINDAAANRSPGVRRFGGNPAGPEWSADTPFSGASPGAMAFQAATYTAAENAGSVAVTVTRSGGSSGAASVSYQTTGGTATPGADYEGVSGILSWNSGDASAKSFTITLLDDLIDENNETVGISLTGASGAALGSPTSATLSITDNDPAPSAGSLQFSASGYSVNESGGSVTLAVTRSGGTSGSVSVSYASSNGTASAGADYGAVTGTLSWANGVGGTRSINVPVFTDALLEGNETVNVILSGPAGGATLGTPAQAVVTIVDSTTANPVPVNSGLSPSSATAGDSGLVLTVSGSNFIAGSVVRWNTAARPTTFISANELEAQIGSSDLANEGQAPVTVFNPAPGGGVSNARTFSIVVNPTPNPVPSASSLSPNSTTAGSGGFVLSVAGAGFASNAVVRWNGADRVTTFVSPTQINANILAGDVVSSGTATVLVFNPAPGGGVSNTLSFTINGSTGPNPLPALDSLAPNAAVAGQQGGFVTINGAQFTPTSVTRWNGSNRPTSYLSATQLQVTLSTSDLQAPGIGTITVNTPAPGGGVSSPQSFFVQTSGQTLIFDDFNRVNSAAIGNGWIEKTAAAFSLTTREAVKQAVNTSDPDNIVYRPASENLLDVEALVEFRLLTTSVGYPELFARVQTGTVATKGRLDAYMLYVDDRSGRAVLARHRGMTATTLATLQLSRSLDTTSRYRMRLTARGSSSVVLTAFVERCNGDVWEVIGSANYTDTSSSRLSTAGSVGFGGFTEASYVFDNFARR